MHACFEFASFGKQTKNTQLLTAAVWQYRNQESTDEYTPQLASRLPHRIIILAIFMYNNYG